MKQKWPILIFSALLTAFIVLAGIWGNAQFQQPAQRRRPYGPAGRQGHRAGRLAAGGSRPVALSPSRSGKIIPSLTLCVTNTAVPLAA